MECSIGGLKKAAHIRSRPKIKISIQELSQVRVRSFLSTTSMLSARKFSYHWPFIVRIAYLGASEELKHA